MVNFNGVISEPSAVPALNRGFLFGDGIFETVRVSNGRVNFLEDHYFRLMASMRIVRMQIPANFTMEYFEAQLLSISDAYKFQNCRVRLTVFRNGGGLYTPTDRSVSFVVTASELASNQYSITEGKYEIELFKDFFVSANLLSSLKTTGRILNVTAGIYAEENGYQSCLLLNDSKNVIEAISGNVFMLTGKKLVTPPITDGALNGIMRKQVIKIARQMDIDVVEESISPFELQRADEIFITNVIQGIQPVSRYRKKDFADEFAKSLIQKLNVSIS